MLDLANNMIHIARHPVNTTTSNNTVTTTSGVVHMMFTGDVHASVLHAEPGSDCMAGRQANDVELRANVSAEAMLCTTSEKGTEQGRKRVMMIGVRTMHNTWDDILSLESFGLNLWHFHANMFAFWITLHLQTLSLSKLHPNSTVSGPSTLIHDDLPAVVLVLPDRAWQRIDATGSTDPFRVSAGSLRTQLTTRGALLAALTGLQGMADWLGGHVIAASRGTSLGKLRGVLWEAGYDERADSWVTPPGKEGFLWRMSTYTEDYVQGVRHCPGSLVTQYVKTMFDTTAKSIAAATATQMKMKQSDGDDDDDDDDEDDDDATAITNRRQLQFQLGQRQGIARHVCFLSRQTRTRKGEPERFRLRNFQPDVFSRLVLQLGSAVILTPQLHVADDLTVHTELPLDMSRASVGGQLRFVHRECAVLMGIHGAGLTNALGMRAGTTVVEFQMEEKQYSFFRNLAALMDGVEYVRVFANGTRFDSIFEGDFYFDDVGERSVDGVVKLVKRELRKAVRRQIDIAKGRKKEDVR